MSFEEPEKIVSGFKFRDYMDNKEAILKSLSNPPVALTAYEIRTRLRVKSLKLQDYQIISELRKLHSDGSVRLDAGRWSIVGLERKIIETSNKENNVQSFNHRAIPDSLQIPTSTEWAPGKSPILNIDFKEKEATEGVVNSENQYAGAWGRFRRLLNYYADCVKNEEGAEASAYLTDFQKRFIYLNQFGSWYPKAGKKWALKIPISFLNNFVNNPELYKEEAVLILGYPLQVWSNKDAENAPSSFIKPIFTFQLDYKRTSQYFEISCDDPWPEVNLGWLEYAIRKPEEQRGFLAACGLILRSNSGECLNDGIHYTISPEFPTLASVITSTFGERVKESIRPESVSSMPLCERPESGIYNRAVIMVGNRTRYAKNLIRELHQIGNFSDEQLDQTALKCIFKDEKSSKNSNSSIPHEGIVLETTSLNCEQREAVSSLLQGEISVITGPPGTGKSQVVAAAIMNSRLKGQTVIFTSRNHKAIDAVVNRLNGKEESPVIIRANSKEDPFLNVGFEEAISRLLSEQYIYDAHDRWKKIQIEIDDLLTKRGELAQQANEIQNLRDRIGEIEGKMSEISILLTKEFINELNDSLNDFPIKIVKELRQNFKDFIHIKRKLSFIEELIWSAKLWKFLFEIKILISYLNKCCPSFKLEKFRISTAWLAKFSVHLEYFYRAVDFCQFRKELIPIENKLKTLPKFEDVVEQINTITNKLEIKIPQAIQLDLKRRTGLPKDADRESFATLRSSLRGLNNSIANDQDRTAVRDALEKFSPTLLQHFPAWGVTNLTIGSRLPLVPALFDLAIIDEASQCDIPSAIPILFRSKKVGVVGDPYQLSHVTKIKGSKDVLLRKRHGLTQVNNDQRFAFPDTSLYDLFAQTNGVNPTLLRDTYRSVDEIAAYSNDLFYKGSLRVLTLSDKLNIPKGTKPGIHWSDVKSEIRTAGPHGCIAPQEIEEIVRILRKLLLEDNFSGTVGVVTPFHQQKIRLMDKVVSEFSFEVRQRSNLIVDTSHGFQGDERDVIIMSLCSGPDMPQGSLGFIRENPNLMNVAVSRARAVIHIVGNKDWVEKCGIKHLQRLVFSPLRSAQRTSNNNPFYPHESPWEKILYDALKEQGVLAEPQRPIVGRRLDLSLERANKRIDIEVDGDCVHRNPDGTRKHDDVWRDIQLQAIGWKVMRFWVYELREDLKGCVNKILKEWS